MSLNSLKHVFVMLSLMVATCAGAQKTSKPASRTTQKADTKQAAAAEKTQLVNVNKVEKADEISIRVYGSGPRQLTLNDLIDFDKLRAAEFTGKPVDVYLGSIATGVDIDKVRAAIKEAGGPRAGVYPSSYATQSEGPWFEHYYGTIREEGVVSDIGCVKWASIHSELQADGMLCMRVGIYPALDEKPEKLHGGVLSRQGGVFRFR